MSEGDYYEAMSNEELLELLNERVPASGIAEVNDFNRQTVIAYLTIVRSSGSRQG